MIAAAGSGQRLGAGGPKAFVEVAGRRLIEWSLAALAEAASVGEVVLVVPAGFEASVDAVAVAGGATRAESVVAGLGAVSGDVVVIQDAARPLVTAKLIDRVVERLVDSGADSVIAAAPVSDTLKRAGEGGAVGGTVDRAGLWAAQTPQAFRVEALRAAQLAASEAGELATATDEAWLIERVGGTVLLEEVGAPNLKVTSEADLAVAAALLRG
ncbi:MAG: 2-C-methyl-D-erythritol 4-phosphate cytidylyltransferase [Actinomycetota bacterium]|nr:2-C-methyl-D-erythritol 4-phosphate cytidylyltransferase [Actinomycetota bacterium]